MESRSNLIEHTHFKKKKSFKKFKKFTLNRDRGATNCCFWQVPRRFAEPRRFVIVFERRMDAQKAGVNLNGEW